MKLATIASDGRSSIALIVGDRAIDLGADLAAAGYPAEDVSELLATGGLDAARDCAARAEAHEGRPIAETVFLPPVHRVNLLAIAANYRDHVLETKVIETAERQESTPWLFTKPAHALNPHGSPIRLPGRFGEDIDWEAELAVIIGRTAKDVPVERALDYVAGYTIANDISARRMELPERTKLRDRDRFHDWLHGKWFDTFLCLGPWMTTADEIPDPSALHLRLDLNGETMQSAPTSDMIFSTEEIISFASSLTTLEPGDVIATGTPSGVGKARGRFLRDGDVVSATIDGIGSLANPVAADS